MYRIEMHMLAYFQTPNVWRICKNSLVFSFLNLLTDILQCNKNLIQLPEAVLSTFNKAKKKLSNVNKYTIS